ncbi:hypothetical protein Plhal710r2_c006g0029081 [Plasmopara halstedii]
MTGIPADDQRDLKMYIFSDKWICKITSEYALRRLGSHAWGRWADGHCI